MRYTKFMKRALMVAAGVTALSAALDVGAADHRLSLDVSGLLDLEALEALTPDGLEQRYTAEGFKTTPFVTWLDEGRSEAVLSRRPYSNIEVALTCLQGTLPLQEARVKFDNGRAVGAAWIVGEAEVKEDNADRLKAAMTAAFGGMAPERPQERVSGWRRDLEADSVMWKSADATARLDRGPGFIAVSFGRGEAGLSPVPLMARAQSRDAEEEVLSFFVRLDPLMREGRLWSMTQDALELAVPVPKGLRESPHFNWTTQSKEGARFAKRIFNNTQQDILLFFMQQGAAIFPLIAVGHPTAKLLGRQLGAIANPQYRQPVMQGPDVYNRGIGIIDRKRRTG